MIFSKFLLPKIVKDVNKYLYIQMSEQSHSKLRKGLKFESFEEFEKAKTSYEKLTNEKFSTRGSTLLSKDHELYPVFKY